MANLYIKIMAAIMSKPQYILEDVALEFDGGVGLGPFVLKRRVFNGDGLHAVLDVFVDVRLVGQMPSKVPKSRVAHVSKIAPSMSDAVELEVKLAFVAPLFKKAAFHKVDVTKPEFEYR